ncbi:MAG TPA: hypothetical protein ENI64_09860 [Gammaproteobacteria bacterium]|nr:hypothetical protein [Gammaproteobacteria bacterium]
MKNLLRITALTLLALSVSVLPLRGFANMNTMDCCQHLSKTRNQGVSAPSETEQYSKTDCPHQDSCKSGDCLNTSSCSTSGPGITSSNLLSFKSVNLIPHSLADHFYTSQSTSPLLKPPL